MMYGRGKSDEAVVAGKPANKAERSAAESVKRRAEAKGNASQQRTLWTQGQAARVTGAGRMRTITSAMERSDPRWEPYAGKPHVRICAGGEEQSSSLPRPRHHCGSSSGRPRIEGDSSP
jgi:ParB-like chromosome segregation protein Spo0J